MARIRCPAHGGKALNCSVWRDASGRAHAKCWSRGCPERAILAALGADAGPRFNIDTGRSQQHSALARKIWDQSRSSTGTLVDRYLRQRGVDLALPATLRFDAAL